MLLGPFQRTQRGHGKGQENRSDVRGQDHPFGPLTEFEFPVDKRGPGGGGGIAGITSALSLTKQGFEVYLAEKEPTWGEWPGGFTILWKKWTCRAFLEEKIRQVYKHPLIHVYTNAVIKEATGYVGNFTTRITYESRDRELHHGVTIVATGAEEYEPTEYLYRRRRPGADLGGTGRAGRPGDEGLINAPNLVMIQCVGCRNEKRNYCSRVCCSHSVKNALKLKELNHR